MNAKRECVLWSIQILCSYFRTRAHAHTDTSMEGLLSISLFLLPTLQQVRQTPRDWPLLSVYVRSELPAPRESLIYGQSVKYLNWDLLTWVNPSERNPALLTGQGLCHVTSAMCEKTCCYQSREFVKYFEGVWGKGEWLTHGFGLLGLASKPLVLPKTDVQ